MSLSIAGILLLSVYSFYNGRVAQQEANNKFLEKTTNQLSFKIASIKRLEKKREALLLKNAEIEASFFFAQTERF